MTAARRKADGTVPAVVLGLSPTGLAVARSLARRGIRVVGVDERRTPASRSRSLEFRHAPIEGDRAWVAFLTALADRLGGRPVLLWTADTHAERVARLEDELRDRYRFITADRSVVEGVASKLRFAELARRLGLPVPASTLLADVAEDRLAEVLPCVLKPEDSTLWTPEVLAALGVEPAKAIAVRDPSALRDLRARFEGMAGRVIVQAMVDGPDENHLDYHALIDGSGAILGEFVGRKLRLAPPHFGLGTLVVSERDDEVVREGRRILGALGYVGVANINFKRDERTGELLLLEVNPRFSLWTGLDVACGVDLPYWAYRAAAGLPAVSGRGHYPRGRVWMHWLWDLRPARQSGGRLWALRWLRDAARADTDAVLSARDPAPAIADVVAALGRRLLR